MTVYVDNAAIPYGRRGVYRMSHMAADTLAELHVFVAVLGIRAYFDNHPEHPHYDVNQWQRRDAVACGAVEVRPRELLAVAICARRNHESAPPAPPV